MYVNRNAVTFFNFESPRAKRLKLNWAGIQNDERMRRVGIITTSAQWHWSCLLEQYTYFIWNRIGIHIGWCCQSVNASARHLVSYSSCTCLTAFWWSHVVSMRRGLVWIHYCLAEVIAFDIDDDEVRQWWLQISDNLNCRRSFMQKWNCNRGVRWGRLINTFLATN